MDDVLEDWRTANVPERTRAALKLLECMTLRPLEIDSAFIRELINAGLDEHAIREAANVCFHYNLINRVADVFDFPVPQGGNKARLAKILNFSGRRLKGSAADEIWVRGKDGRIRPTEVEHGRQRIFSAEGETDPSLRQAVDAFVVAQWGKTRSFAPLVPDHLQPYLKKLSLYAYRITDKDIQELKEAGYTEAMIYEITIVASFAAALVGLEQLFAALYGEVIEKNASLTSYL